MAKRKCANGGNVKSPQSMKDQLMALRPGYAAGMVPGMAGQVANFQSGLAPLGIATGATAPNALAGVNAQSLAASLGPDQAGAGVGALVTAPAAAPAAPPAGNVLAAQGGNVSTPGLQTMAEKQQAAGINPNAAYRPGSAQDPHASGLSWVTAAQRIAGSNAAAAAMAPNQQAPQSASNPLDLGSKGRVRQQTQTPGLRDGGVPGVYRRGNTFSDRPMTGVAGSASRDPVATTQKPVQQIAQPAYPQERHAAQASAPSEQQTGIGLPGIGDVVDMINRRKAANREAAGMADGGMVRHRFEGKGGPRDDQIPVTVAGEKIKVSDGEEAVILPAKTAKNPQAIAQISDVIQQSNDGRQPAMGMSQGGKYQAGAVNRYPYDGKIPPTAQEVYAQTGLVGQKAAVEPAYDYAARGQPTPSEMQMLSADQVPASGAKWGSLKDAFLYNSDVAKQQEQAQGGMSKAAAVAPYSSEGRKSAILSSNTTPNQQIAQTTGSANGATFDQDTGNLYFTEKGYDPTKQAMAAGTGAITDQRTGRTIMITGAGVPDNPNAPRDRHGNDMTATLEARDQLMRQRADNAWSLANSPHYGAEGREKLQMLQQIGALDTATTQRQGMAQQQAANLPDLDRQLKGQQIAAAGMATQQAQELNALYAAHNSEQNPEKRARIAEQIRVRTGKDRTDKPIAVDMGETISPDGMMKSKNPNVLYDPNTRQTIRLDGGRADITTTSEASKIKADYQAKKITKEQASAMLAKLEGR